MENLENGTTSTQGEAQQNGVNNLDQLEKRSASGGKRKNRIKHLLDQAEQEEVKKVAMKIDRRTLAKIQFLGLEPQILFEALCDEFFDRKEVRDRLKKINEEEQIE